MWIRVSSAAPSAREPALIWSSRSPPSNCWTAWSRRLPEARRGSGACGGDAELDADVRINLQHQHAGQANREIADVDDVATLGDQGVLIGHAHRDGAGQVPG